jgi:antirestriction protein ArdC
MLDGQREGGSHACYVISVDNIHVPCIDFFRDAESYYVTLAHETRALEASRNAPEPRFRAQTVRR